MNWYSDVINSTWQPVVVGNPLYKFLQELKIVLKEWINTVSFINNNTSKWFTRIQTIQKSQQDIDSAAIKVYTEQISNWMHLWHGTVWSLNNPYETQCRAHDCWGNIRHYIGNTELCRFCFILVPDRLKMWECPCAYLITKFILTLQLFLEQHTAICMCTH